MIWTGSRWTDFGSVKRRPGSFKGVQGPGVPTIELTLCILFASFAVRVNGQSSPQLLHMVECVNESRLLETAPASRARSFVGNWSLQGRTIALRLVHFHKATHAVVQSGELPAGPLGSGRVCTMPHCG